MQGAYPLGACGALIFAPSVLDLYSKILDPPLHTMTVYFARIGHTV